MSRGYPERKWIKKNAPHREAKAKSRQPNIHINSAYHQEKAGDPQTMPKEMPSKARSTRQTEDFPTLNNFK
jgi:hypothetical protein